jgi:hypothetical protein
MRSIGKIKIKKLKAICQEELRRPDLFNNFPATGYAATSAARARIAERVPSDWMDTWESAWNEIERIIDDEVTAFVYAPKTVTR